jgi:DNA-binding response OmpR family regulator
VHIKNLRAKLGTAGDRIETVYGVGYRMRSDE